MLPLWVEFFEDLQFVRGRSKNTIMAYQRDLEMYDQFLETKQSIPFFFPFMKERNLSLRSQARVISSVRTYFRFCEDRGVPQPELLELRPPKVKVSLPRPLSQLEFDRLFLAAHHIDANRTARNQMALLLLYGLGCRVSELIGLSLEDFHESERWVRIVGKGNKERILPLTEHLALNLKKYLNEVREHLLKNDKSNAVIINDRGHRPSRVDVWRWLAAWSKSAGFDEPVHPHRFRHGCATALLENGADLRSIQILLGHASIQTTQVYTSVSHQHLVRTVDEHHPLSALTKDELEL